MAFDGISRPSQLNAYADPLNPYIGANDAAESAKRKPKIKGNRETFEEDETFKKLDQYHGDDNDGSDDLSEEEREEIMKFARIRGIVNFALESGVTYEFTYNEESGLVDLQDTRDGKVMLSLSIDELLGLSDRMARYCGLMTNREA